MHINKFLFSLFISFILLNTVLISCFAEETSYVWSPEVTKTTSTMPTDIEETNAEVSSDNSLSLESGSAILIEQSTGQILYAHNIHEQLRPASVTKIMSILLIMEAVDSGKISSSFSSKVYSKISKSSIFKNSLQAFIVLFFSCFCF